MNASDTRSGIYIDGKFVAAGSRRTVEVVEKATGRVIGAVAEATGEDVDRAVAGARRAQRDWERQTIAERAVLLRAAARLLSERRADFEDMLIREAGSTRAKAAGEVALTIEEFEAAAFLTTLASTEVIPSAVAGRVNLIERRPVGCVALITAFNFPLHIAARILAPALALGNAVLLKPAPLTPLAGGVMIAELVRDAGLPDGLVQVLPGDTAGPALVAHPDVEMVHFTGSQPVGRAIAVEAARTFKKVALELGGNSASVVFPDADVALAARSAASAAFNHQGQVCIATSRHLVFREVADEYTERLSDIAANLTVGDPAEEDVDLGPLISSRQLERVDALVRDSVGAGAKVAVGARQEGLFYWPTVVTAVTPAMPLFQSEIFGPVAPVTLVGSSDEALELVNGVSHALSAAVFTADLAAGWSFAERMRAGMVHVNEPTALHEVHVPFGGIGASGVGDRLGGTANITLLTERRWLSLQR